MNSFLSASQTERLKRIVRNYKEHVKLGRPWNLRTDDDLWRQVLGQIAVVGRAAPGERLQQDPKIKRLVSIKKLRTFENDARLQKHLHDIFVDVRVRFVGKAWKDDRKAAAAVRNFRTLMAAGGPKKFFKGIASCRTEEEKIKALQKALRYYGNKGARDTLIELRLAENCVALDVRILGVLRKVGAKVSLDDIYNRIENELVKKVAEPLQISGARLDRILFQNYKQIMKYI